MKELLYLSLDSLEEGVGASQVLAYMRKISQKRPVKIISFEKTKPTSDRVSQIESTNLRWDPLPFGRYGLIGGFSRVFRMWQRIERHKIIHARSTLPGIAALLKIPNFWIWDCRSLQADQRLALKNKNRLNLEILILRGAEYLLAKFSSRIIVITKAVVPVLQKRYGLEKSKIHFITTCVDTEKFYIRKRKKNDNIRILMSGTFSPAYDINLINQIIVELKLRTKVELTVATGSGATSLWQELQYSKVVSVPHHQMPNLIQDHDLGISIWKNDLGICLTSVASTKTAEFLSCGKPVLINELQGDYGDLVKKSKVGIVTSKSDRKAVINYAEQIINLMKDKNLDLRCRETALKYLSIDAAIVQLENLYSQADT